MNGRTGPPTEPWFKVAFGPHYRALYAARDDASARAEAAFAARATSAEPGARWLDAACGDGRHAAALGEAGFDVVGFDLSPDLLDVARARPGLRCVRGDLRRPPFAPSSFGVVSLFFTSFGYFDDATDLAVLAALKRLLRSGGRLFLDVPDVERLRATLVPESESATSAGLCRARRRIVGVRVEKEIELVPRDGSAPLRYVESVRLYEPAELRAMFAATGLLERASYGAYDGRASGTGDRFIAVAENVE